MQVNPAVPNAPAVSSKETTAAQQPAVDQVAAVNTVADAAVNDSNAVAKTFARLENALVQWFFQQRPELGNTLTQLLSLQEQLSAQLTGDNMQAADVINEKIVKIVDMMKLLLIAPRGEQEVQEFAQTSPQMLLELIAELDNLKEEQPPSMQAKLDDLAAKLTNMVKQTGTGQQILPDQQQNVQQQAAGNAVTGENVPLSAENRPVKDGSTAASTANMPADSSTPTTTGETVDSQDPPVQMTKALPAGDAEAAAEVLKGGETGETAENDGETAARLLKSDTGAPGKPQEKSPLANAQQPSTAGGQAPESEAVLKQDAALLKAAQNTGSDHETAGTGQGQPATASQGINAEIYVFGANSQIGEETVGQPVFKAQLLQQKLTEILRQFTEELGSEKLEPDAKLVRLLNDMKECVRSLQVNADQEWDRLLQYPQIYKQVLQKALQLMQEMTDTKSNDSLQQNVLNLLNELSANLHVQNTVNQLRQDNPASQTMYFQIPLQVGQQIANGEMLVVHEREKEGNRWKIINSWYRFYLETLCLGQVQVNLHAANKQLNIQFVLTEEEQADFFNEQKDVLAQVLNRYGYDVVDITCGVGNVGPLFLTDADAANRQCIDIMI